jgi:hypothetical protein
MTTFNGRERSFEKIFSIDQNAKFEIEARRDKLLGQWAAAKLGFGVLRLAGTSKKLFTLTSPRREVGLSTGLEGIFKVKASAFPKTSCPRSWLTCSGPPPNRDGKEPSQADPLRWLKVFAR